MSAADAELPPPDEPPLDDEPPEEPPPEFAAQATPAGTARHRASAVA